MSLRASTRHRVRRCPRGRSHLRRRQGWPQMRRRFGNSPPPVTVYPVPRAGRRCRMPAKRAGRRLARSVPLPESRSHAATPQPRDHPTNRLCDHAPPRLALHTVLFAFCARAPFRAGTVRFRRRPRMLDDATDHGGGLVLMCPPFDTRVIHPAILHGRRWLDGVYAAKGQRLYHPLWIRNDHCNVSPPHLWMAPA